MPPLSTMLLPSLPCQLGVLGRSHSTRTTPLLLVCPPGQARVPHTHLGGPSDHAHRHPSVAPSPPVFSFSSSPSPHPEFPHLMMIPLLAVPIDAAPVPLPHWSPPPRLAVSSSLLRVPPPSDSRLPLHHSCWSKLRLSVPTQPYQRPPAPRHQSPPRALDFKPGQGYTPSRPEIRRSAPYPSPRG